MTLGELSRTARQRTGVGVERSEITSFINTIVADPYRRHCTALNGVRGSGKSAALDRCIEAFEGMGFPVARDVTALAAEVMPIRRESLRPWLVVDDVHLADEQVIWRLAELARDQEGPNLLVAHLRGSQSDSVRALRTVMGSVTRPVALGPLSSNEAREWIEGQCAWLSIAARERCLIASGSMPWVLSVVIEVLTELADGREGGVSEIERALAGTAVLPGLITRLSLELDRLADSPRALALALASGADASDLIGSGIVDLGSPRSGGYTAKQYDDDLADLRSGGMLDVHERLIPLVRTAVLHTAPAHRRRASRIELLGSRMDNGRDTADLAWELARQGVQDPRVVSALLRTGHNLLGADPRRAAAAFALASDIGAPAQQTLLPQVEALIATSQLDLALSLLERDRSHIPHVSQPDAAAINAALWLRLGYPERAADAVHSLGADGAARLGGIGAVAVTAAGQLPTRLMASEVDKVPQSPARLAIEAMGTAIVDSLKHDSVAISRSLSSLVRASETLSATGSTALLPDSPAALAALIAIHTGQRETAIAVLNRAIEAHHPNAELLPRLRLLRGWAALLDGDVLTAVEMNDLSAGELAARDELLSAALTIAIAHRADDAPALRRTWPRARAALMRVSIGLFDILALGELVIAAERLREDDAVAGSLADGLSVLQRLGDPPVWGTLLHWGCVKVAIRRNQPTALEPHAAALVRGGAAVRLSGALADVGRSWVAILGGARDSATMTTAEQHARALGAAGMEWDAARFAGLAATQAIGRGDIQRLLHVARDMSQVHAVRADPVSESARTVRVAGPGSPSVREGQSPGPVHPREDARSVLSAREIEVAALVLEGRTYAEIGNTLFISPRTVEHHMARIRRRLNVSSRSELLVRLRSLLSGVGINGGA
ncbi:helix-turn-helix transcriptional regulator [Cumulibacter soli]|uniref:helix-turn-helix transcriptional regulator n=1 Tax=Cumulibacter soli TaxID=2546344 RepID=UPI001419DF6C|nr:helix-turn-helix transcriptional regulator [Cumulibacter soli]